MKNGKIPLRDIHDKSTKKPDRNSTPAQKNTGNLQRLKMTRALKTGHVRGGHRFH
jgi:hypothetical protein